MNKIMFPRIKQLVKKVSDVLNEASIKYLIGGSFAFKLLTNEDIDVHDVDIIVSDKDFDRLMVLLTRPELNLNPIRTPYTIHANRLILKGTDNKPFDISFDSYEYYYNDSGINLNNFLEIEIDGIGIKLTTREDLIKVYEAALKGGNVHKFDEYKRKISILNKV